jgi:two-component system, sensor histidine kinase ChiS
MFLCHPLRAGIMLALLVVVALPAPGTQYAFTVLTPEDGLAATAVYEIDQDEVGHLWFATSEGVSRFDGVRFRNFDVSSGLPDQRVYTMLRDTEGSIWIGHADGVSRFDGRTLRSYSNKDGVGRGVIWSSTLDRHGHPWFGTQNGGVSVWTGTSFRTYGLEAGLPEGFVYGLLADSKDRLWIGTRYRGIAVAEIDAAGNLRVVRNYPVTLVGTRGVRAFREDAWGNVYAATRGNGVIRFDGDTLEPTAGLLEGEDTYALLVNRAGELVVGMGNEGIRIYTLPDLRPRLEVGEREGLPAEVYSLFEDREGGLWIGTGVGVVRWPGEAIRNFDRRDGIPGTYVLGVSADRDGSVWVSSMQGASWLSAAKAVGAGDVVRSLDRRDGLPSSEVWQVLRDSRGLLWIATAAGLCLYTEGRGCRTWGERDGLPSDFVSVLLESADGDLWIGSEGGVVRLEIGPDGRVGELIEVRGHPAIESVNVSSMIEDRSGALWIATDGGLFHLVEKTMSALGEENGLPRRGINDLLIDRQGALWVATSGRGIAFADGGNIAGSATRFSTFGVTAGLPSNTVMSVVEGDGGTVWAGTSAGVAQIDAARIREGAMHVVRRQLTSASGLLGSEPGSGGAFSRGADGTFWFGLARGVSHYDPSRERGVDVPPTVEIGRVVANRETIYVAPFDEIVEEYDPAVGLTRAVLTHRTNEVVFEYRALSFHDPSRVAYQVLLDGFDEEWSAPTKSRIKEYTHLPPGDYVFRVRATSATGLESASTADYALTIRPPFWATDWFPPVVLVSLALLVAAVVQLRSYAVRRRNLELAEMVAARTNDLELRTHELEIANARILEGEHARSRFLAGMSHELRTPLNSIIGFTELMLSRETPRDTRELKFLGNVQHSAHQLLGMITDLLDLAKIEAGTMEVFIDPVGLPPLVESVLSTLEPLSTPRRIDVERDLPDDFPLVRLDGRKVRQILYNLLSNAIRFSPPGSTVGVGLRNLDGGSSPLGHDSILIEVADRGISIPAEEIQTIFEEYHQSPTVSALGLGTALGLVIVRRFAELQGGLVQVAPNDGGGSTFRVWLPHDADEHATDSGPRRILVD